MTYTNFKDMVCSYSNRVAALYASVGAQDIVLIAMNDAIREAQRRYTFNSLGRRAFVSLSMLPKSMLTDFYTTPALSTAMVVKRVDALWEYSSTSIASTTAYFPTKKIELRRRANLEYSIPTSPFTGTGTSNNPVTSDFAYLHGLNLHHSSLTTPTTVMADVVEFIPDHDGGASTNFFLNYGTDWLKFATLGNLNVWLKDSERFNIDANLITNAWNSLTQFDAQQAEMGEVNLD